MSDLGDAAVRYAALGLAVIPLQPKKKKPIFDAWTDIERADVELVRRWWNQTPNANVGILTGQKSNCFVVDVDPRNGGIQTYESLCHQHGRFDDTWKDMTGGEGGGFHLYFRYPNFPVGKVTGLFTGIDIQGNGGQVVAPPSVHPDTGNRYEWDGLSEIEQTPMAEAPPWLLELLQGKVFKTHSDKFPVSIRIPHGVQHETLVALAGMMRRLGLNADEIMPSLWEVNAKRCEQPGPLANIQQIADSMMRYRPSDGNLMTTANRLWRVTKAREMEAKREEDSRLVASVDGLAVYRAPASEQGVVIDEILHHGLTVFAGRPKVGKSWVALQMALSVSQGAPFLGHNVLRPGRVIYAALEESQARTSKRMRKLQTAESVLLQNISMVYRLLPLMGGGLEQLEELIKNQTPNLVIVDTFLSFVGVGAQKRDVLRGEYAEMNVLHKLAERYDIAIVIVHHMRKPVAGAKGLDAVAGSTGLTAAADSVWTMDREDQGICSLDIIGRESEEITLALRFVKDDPERFGWELMGTGEEVKTMKDEREIYTLLREEGTLSVQKVASLLRMNANQARAILYSMSSRGQVNRNSTGGYYLSPAYSREES